MTAINSRSTILRWRLLVAVGSLVTLAWLWVHKTGYSTFQDHRVYQEDGIELPTYAPPFTCNYSALPARTRLVNRKNDSYVVLGHGFPDMITDKFWEGNGSAGWEEKLAAHMERYIAAVRSLDRARDGFMDLGANIGTHALYMAARGHSVHIFEPTRANHVLLHCSLAMSGLAGRVRLNTFGVGDRALRVCMRSAPDNYGDSRVDPASTAGESGAAPGDDACGEAGATAQVGTIDHYYSTFARGQRLAVLKMDVQGFEIAALRRATHLFDSVDAPAAVFFEYDPAMLRAQHVDPQELAEYFWRRDYTIWREDRPEPVDQDAFERFGREALMMGGIDLFAVKNTWRKRLDNAGFSFVGGELRPGGASAIVGHAVHKETRNQAWA